MHGCSFVVPHTHTHTLCNAFRTFHITTRVYIHASAGGSRRGRLRLDSDWTATHNLLRPDPLHLKNRE